MNAASDRRARGRGAALAMAALAVALLGANAVRPQTLLPAPADTTRADAPPDTARLQLRLPATWPAPHSVRVWPDTLVFGAEGALLLEFPAAFADFAPDSLTFTAPWAEFSSPRAVRAPPADLEATTGWRVALALRIYRLGPLRLAVSPSDDGAAAVQSSVAWVRGRTAPDDQPAGVHVLPLRTWNLLVALALVGVATLLVVALHRWLRRARRPVWRPTDRPLPPPPDLAAAEALRELEEAELSARGEGRRHLDRLAAAVRRYVDGRFRVPASELTARELVTAARGRGYPPGEIAAIASWLEEVDRRRYDPAPIAAEACRSATAAAVDLIRRTRVAARYAVIDPARQLAGERAWAWLEARFGDDRAGCPVPIQSAERGEGV